MKCKIFLVLGSALAEEVDDSEEIMFLIQENEGATGRPSLRPQRRQVARTRQSERVRAAIQQLRETRARVRQIITSPTVRQTSKLSIRRKI